MSKPIDKLEFWRERINSAQKEHYSVYVTGEADWKRINIAHEEIFNKEIKQTDLVLDAGCGYGRWSNRFQNYVGIDFSDDFINRAKKNYPNKDFRVMNMKSLDFNDKQFDVSFCVSIKKMVIDNLGKEEWDKMEKELLRVSKRVLLLEYETPEPYEVIV